jgi:hypothetical protein
VLARIYFKCPVHGRGDSYVIGGIVNERFAVIGEWERNEPSTSQPAVDLAEDDAVVSSADGDDVEYTMGS